jgi:hypothetical protein
MEYNNCTEIHKAAVGDIFSFQDKNCQTAYGIVKQLEKGFIIGITKQGIQKFTCNEIKKLIFKGDAKFLEFLELISLRFILHDYEIDKLHDKIKAGFNHIQSQINDLDNKFKKKKSFKKSQKETLEYER